MLVEKLDIMVITRNLATKLAIIGKQADTEAVITSTEATIK
jgi:hypothetical protein